MNRNIDVGAVVREVFEIFRDQAAVLLPAALVIFVADGLIRGALVAISPILGILAAIISLVAVGLYRGMVVQLVADVQDGRRDSSVGDLFRSVVPVLLPLIVTSLLFGLGVGIGLILLIVPGLFLATIWAVVQPVVVLERPGILESFGRSRQLVRGNGWQVFGVIVVFALIFLLVGLILGAIGGALGATGSLIAGILSSVITAPLLALAGTVLYFHLRAGAGGLSAGGPAAAGVGTGTGAPSVGGGPPPAGQPASPAGATTAPRSGAAQDPPPQAPPPGAGGADRR